ncbi:MAG: hypothetical protein WBA12_13745, partial [Catalinimonas sp.]
PADMFAPDGEVPTGVERDLAMDLMEETPTSTDATLRAITLGERTLLRLLIEHGRHPTKSTAQAAMQLLAELEDLTFLNPLHRRVLDHVRLLVEGGSAPTVEQFVRSDDEDVQQLTIDLTTHREQLSAGWWDVHRIKTTTEEDPAYLETEIIRQVNLYKWMRLKQDQEAFRRQHRDACKAGNLEEELLLIRTLMRVKEMEMALARPLGNVVSG